MCRLDTRLVHCCFNGAMPFQAWIRDVLCNVSRRVPASMGPCPFRHGYLVHKYTRLAIEDLLQWGHALSGMDTLSAGDKTTVYAWLQWGHALSGMDTTVAVVGTQLS